MGKALHSFIRGGFALALSVTACACGSTIAENAALADKPLQASTARLKIYRAEGFVGMGAGARVRVDGREVADIGSGGSTIIDVASGSHDIVVDSQGHPNVYTLKLDAKPGMMYSLEVSVREEAAVAGMFGAVGMLAEAASNENGGTFKVRVADSRPVKK